MAHSGNFYDNRTLFIKCEGATPGQIGSCFRLALDEYQSKYKTNLNCRFRVNLVENKEGHSFGIAFVFVTNPAVYYMLLGKNPDGSDRIEYRDDPSWEQPKEGEIINDSGWSAISPPVFTPGMSWADMVEEEDAYNDKVAAKLVTEKLQQEPPKIPIPLEPLMVLPPYKLTPEQIAEKRAKIIEDNSGKKDFDPSLIEIPDLAYLSVDRAMAIPLDSKFMPNILKCKDVPDWITKEDLKMEFTPYATDSKTLQERFVKGRRSEETYPFVNINQDRVAFIIFDPSTHDAQFALHMMKKTVIKKTASDRTVKTATLIFSHSFRTERDIMADISQQPRPVQRKTRDQPSQSRQDAPRSNVQRTAAKAKAVAPKAPSFSSKNAFDILQDNDN